LNEALATGVLTQLAPGVRRLIAPNGGIMTGPGTNTYLVGDAEVAVIDPGPFVEAHVEAIRAAAPGPIRWVLVTHTHPDHSPGAQALAATTGAVRVGQPAPPGAWQDRHFAPDIVLEDGERIVTEEFALRAVHTPGHASNHVCYLHEGLSWLFTGDHVMNGSTVVVSPPDGNMTDYLASLRRIRDFELTALAPGHGNLLDDPCCEVDWIIAHRLEREARVVAALSAMHEKTGEELVAEVYDEIDPHLHAVAMQTLLAHLIKLEDDGRARDTGSGWILEDAAA
jgi:glyoxylase-like metal-dependent hydrolase (beta-lactamase superfamily II)